MESSRTAYGCLNELFLLVDSAAVRCAVRSRLAFYCRLILEESHKKIMRLFIVQNLNNTKGSKELHLWEPGAGKFYRKAESMFCS